MAPRILKAKHKENAKRTIITVYYHYSQVVKRNVSTHANNAVVNCVSHMQLNTYEATHAEVYDEVTGIHHASIRRTMKGMSILYKREVKENY